MNSAALNRQTFRKFTDHEHQTWKILFNHLEENRRTQADTIFTDGIAILGINNQRVPDIDEVNAKLANTTGFKGVPVEGLEMNLSFYPALAKRQYPIGNFLRSAEDIAYTPAPDVFHDLYGHMPFFANETYADFCEGYAKMVCKYLHEPERLKKFERFFWFSIEFALIETDKGRRIFGAGILSSKAESNYALSSEPAISEFNIAEMINQEYFVDKFQPRLFLLRKKSQLYTVIDQVEDLVLASTPV